MFETYKQRLEKMYTDSTGRDPQKDPKLKDKTIDSSRFKLSVEVKYEIATTEYDYLKTCVDEGKTKSDSMIETLRVRFV